MRFMLYEFLKDNYKEAEPIFFSDIVIKGLWRVEYHVRRTTSRISKNII